MYAQRIPVGKLDWLSNRNSGYPLTPVVFAAAFQSRKSSPFERIARDKNATNCLPQFCTWQGHIQLSRLPGRVREAIWLAHARRPVADATSRGIRPFAKNWPRGLFSHAPWSPSVRSICRSGYEMVHVQCRRNSFVRNTRCRTCSFVNVYALPCPKLQGQVCANQR